MFVRLVIALITSPIYGVLAALATLPLILFSGVLSVVLSSLMPTEGGTEVLVIAIIAVPLALIASFMIQVLITVQTARYAASFSGAKALKAQPSFTTAFWRGFFVILLFTIAIILLTICTFVLLREYWDAIGLPRPDPEEIQAWVAQLLLYLEIGEALGPDARMIGWTILGAQAMGLLYYVLLALVLVPRVSGIGSEGGRTWTGGYLAFRIFIGLPCSALMIAIIASGIVIVIELVTGAWPNVLRWAVVFMLEGFFVSGAMFALEAMILKAGRETRDEAREVLAEIEKGAPQDYRSLRKQWSER